MRPDLTLDAASVQSMPFARPSFADVLAAVKFVAKNNYLARAKPNRKRRRNGRNLPNRSAKKIRKGQRDSSSKWPSETFLVNASPEWLTRLTRQF